MTDHAELRRLAKAATPGEWSAVWEEGDDTAWPNLFPIIQAENGETVIGNEGFYSDLEQDKANAQFCAAANPKTVLAMLDEIDGLKAENCAHKDTQKHCEWLAEDLKECASALPGTYYMDPPDGGNVSIPEQIRRMAKDAARYRALRQKERGVVVVRNRTSHLFGEHLDAAIDAAIEGAKQ
ncbi:ead/Ea22-like family protein [Pseudomonas aeruginosa]